MIVPKQHAICHQLASKHIEYVKYSKDHHLFYAICMTHTKHSDPYSPMCHPLLELLRAQTNLFFTKHFTYEMRDRTHKITIRKMRILLFYFIALHCTLTHCWTWLARLYFLCFQGHFSSWIKFLNPYWRLF